MMFAAAVPGCHRPAAQPLFGIGYTTELQTDFREMNWVNLLKMDFSRTLGKGFRDRPRIDQYRQDTPGAADRRPAGIFEYRTDNLPFSLSVAGLSFSRGASCLFAGLRNMNEDYFASPVTSLFTNSSCGIFPTIAANYSIANYPLSSLGIHYTHEKERWRIQASLYNGRGYNGFAADNFLFRFRPVSDGLFGITSLNYRNHGSSYHLGGVLYNGFHICEAEAEKDR